MVEDRVCVVTDSVELQLFGWVNGLAAEEVAYLLDVATVDHETTLTRAAAQDSRIIAIFGWSLVGIGTLAVTNTIAFSLDLQGIASMSAIAAAIVVLFGGTYALWPRELALGVGAEWFSLSRGLDRQKMQAYVLTSLLVAVGINDLLLARRSVSLKMMIAGLVAEIVSVILVVVAAAN